MSHFSEPEPHVPSSYPVPDTAVPVSAGMIVALPAELVTSLLKNGRDLGESDVSALVVGGMERIRTGGATVFVKVVAVTRAVVARDGQVRAEGRPYDHARLGPLEDWLDAQAGPGVIDGIAERALLDKRYVKGKYRRLLTAAFMIRVIVLWTLVPEAQLSDVIVALAGDLALLPLVTAVAPGVGAVLPGLAPGPGARAAGGTGDRRARHGTRRARRRRGGIPGRRHRGAAVRALVRRVAAAGAGHAREPGRVRVPPGTADDSAAWPSVRLFPLGNCLTRSMLTMTRGAAGTGKTASEQGLLDTVLLCRAHVLSKRQVWIMDRLWPGTAHWPPSGSARTSWPGSRATST